MTVTARTIEPQPGWSHAATREQTWNKRHLWGIGYVAALGVVVAVYFLVTGQVHTRRDVEALVIMAAAWSLPWLWLMWYVDPKVRQRRYLRKYPWVAYDAHVSGFTTKILRCVVTFTDDQGKQRNYRVEPNDDDYARGNRTIWFAGVPGRTAAVVSLREGACTGMAYVSQYVPSGSAAGPGGRS